MSSNDKHPASVSGLLKSLRSLQEEEPKAVRSTVHLYPPSLYAPNDTKDEAEAEAEGSSSTSLGTKRITSWKMTEHMYFKANNKFPTLARGLFTEEVDGQERIVARGYDKFFNTDETAWTNWDGMKHHTQAPYHLTLKSNGCLILISALSPNHLVVASKHSLGTTTEAQAEEAIADGVNKLSVKGEKGKGKEKVKEAMDEHSEAQQHAEVGRMWLSRTLNKSGKREEDLARQLWDQNFTAVLELCDDSFEEHVIATPAHWTGLHLHGLNHNTPHFETLPPDQVAAFADDFGFIPTKYITLQTLEEVKAYTSDVAKSGSWEGEMIEGFVVRSTVADSDPTSAKSRPPYRPGSPFFFKVKFEEPYLLYRTWREVTRLMLPLRDRPSAEKEEKTRKQVRSKTKRPEVEVYVNWVDKMLVKEPRLFDEFERGVVRVRERFLQWTRGEGKQEWEDAVAGKGVKSLVKGKMEESKEARRASRAGLPKKFVIVPMAVPGCGKTLIGLALKELFGFGHTQSDDVTTKKTAPTFLKNIASLLEKEDVVYADRNNHLSKHYDELTDMPFNTNLGTGKTLKMYDVRFIGLLWDVDDLPYHRVLRVCSERVVKRGDNHQTLRPDPTIEAEHEAIVGNFLRSFTAPDPQDFERVIQVGVEDDALTILRKAVDPLVDILGLLNPDDGTLQAALDKAGEYKTTTPYHAPARISKTVRYFGLAPEIDLPELVSSLLKSHPDESAQAFLQDLVSKSRIVAKPHVTLSHENNVQAEKNEAADAETPGESQPGPHQRCWDQCQALASEGSSTSAMYQYNITHLVWDDRVMSLVIDTLEPSNPETIQLEVPEDYVKHLHITVGTRTEEIPAFESRGIVGAAIEGIAAGQDSGEAKEVVEGGGKVRWFSIEGIKGEGRVKGMW